MPSRVLSSQIAAPILVALVVLCSVLTLVSCGKPQAAATQSQGMFSQAAPDGSKCALGVYTDDPPPVGERPAGMVWIPGGEFSMGSNNPKFSDARPWHRVRLSGFWIAKTPVTNDQFARFVNATHYVTVAERKPSPKDFPGAPPDKLVAGSLVFTPPAHPVELNDDSQWWRYQPGANWRHPEGPRTSIAGKGDYPVVQIAYEDAQAYAKWAGKRLPTEAQFEFAERGGLDCKQFAWGSQFEPHGKPMANTYHGHFPDKSTAKHNDPTTTPVGSFPANGYGLYDMSGNVWEWTSDWYRADYYQQLSTAGPVAIDPKGPADSYDPQEPGVAKHSVRGGSFLCTDQFCSRYEVGGRGQTEPSSSANHIGFRVAL
ncbi:MAG: formylglycine-generating enzyme family protein [Candidatus Eremiobacteraeota bacterium]|nr:formylglycine-generating enzyme family protein [Candidatus Eremiobacteraeota bacterium]MBV8364910.1 formylglycine-generating enzyme family protein [Candidatus Eremiobacteraeota bacterium]